MLRLIWSSGDLVIQDSDTPLGVESPIQHKLFYMHKSLQANPKMPWIKESVKERANLWKAVAGQPVHTIVTYQGLLDRVVSICKQAGLQYEIVDNRDPFPNPQVDKMKGFRHTQFSATLKLLGKQRSGLFKAVTRWGKSSILTNVMRAFPGVPTVLAAPGVDLLNQLVDELRVALPDREITGIFSGARAKNKRQCEDITVCSLDSLDKIIPEQVRLLLIDEPHAIASASRILNVSKFKNARIYGFGATVTGRYDGADALVEGLVGPVLFEKTFREAVQEGAVCEIEVFMLRIKFDPFPCNDRNQAYKQLIFQNHDFDRIVQQISNLIPQDWQTLIFADQVAQIDLINTFVENGVAAIASRMSKKERDERFEQMKSGEIKRCIATNIYSTGVTFPDLRCIINAAGGGGSITGTQKPGRLAQIRPGKKAGYLIDFMFSPNGREEDDRPGYNEKWSAVVYDCKSRLKVYQANGYKVKMINSVDEIKLE